MESRTAPQSRVSNLYMPGAPVVSDKLSCISKSSILWLCYYIQTLIHGNTHSICKIFSEWITVSERIFTVGWLSQLKCRETFNMVVLWNQSSCMALLVKFSSILKYSSSYSAAVETALMMAAVNMWELHLPHMTPDSLTVSSEDVFSWHDLTYGPVFIYYCGSGANLTVDPTRAPPQWSQSILTLLLVLGCS